VVRSFYLSCARQAREELDRQLEEDKPRRLR